MIEPLERMLAGLLRSGTWIASATIAVGLIFGAKIATLGIAVFILLPPLRVLLMLIMFLRARQYRFASTAALVLGIIALSLVVGSAE